MSLDEAAMVEPVAVGIYAARLALPTFPPAPPLEREGSTLVHSGAIVVLGAGAIGLSALQAAKAMGAERTIVSEPVKARRELASKLGATEVVDPSTSDAEAEILRLTGGFGAEVVIECTGEDDATLQASRIVRVMGRIVVVGIPESRTYAFEASPSRRKELTVVFCRRSNLTAETAIRWIAEGKIDAAEHGHAPVPA